MKNWTNRVVYLGYLFMVALAQTQTGCTNVLAFGTATKFALDVSQRADQTVDVSLGYDRAEIASIPAPKNVDSTGASVENPGDDAYSVLGTFSVTYGNPFVDSQPLVLDQFFATGWAARIAAKNPRMQAFFGREAHEIATKKKGGE